LYVFVYMYEYTYVRMLWISSEEISIFMYTISSYARNPIRIPHEFMVER